MSGLPLLHQSREPLFRSFLRSINRSPTAKAQAEALSAIPTPSECSLVSFCTSDHGSDSEEEIICDNIDPRENCPSRESISEDSIQEPHNSFVDSGAPARAKRAWDRAPYSWNMVNLFLFGCHLIDRAYVRVYRLHG